MTTGDGPGMGPGPVHPSGREVTCPECGHTVVCDPPPVEPCPECGYRGWLA